jgi:hypothetical protein
MVAMSSTHAETFESAKFVTQAGARLESAAALTPVYDQAALPRSLAGRFVQRECALERLAEAFEPHSFDV